MKMVDVGDKPKTERVAVATGRVEMNTAALTQLRAGTLEKGDVLAAARLAGVMAAKKTPDFIPLCHPISLSGVEMCIEAQAHSVEIRATVRTVDRTGVEMEALTAVTAAALTVYDMLKSLDRAMVIGPISLEHKSGGRSGTWGRSTAVTVKAAQRRRKV